MSTSTSEDAYARLELWPGDGAAGALDVVADDRARVELAPRAPVLGERGDLDERVGAVGGVARVALEAPAEAAEREPVERRLRLRLVRRVVRVREDQVHVQRQVVRQPVNEQRQVRVSRQRVHAVQNL